MVYSQVTGIEDRGQRALSIDKSLPTEVDSFPPWLERRDVDPSNERCRHRSIGIGIRRQDDLAGRLVIVVPVRVPCCW